ncbi:MAG: GAF domain-containing protein [Anaerolineae bacterium]|nr:GAF domain-containing protein [Anaerolineae bacterium]
MWNQIRQWLAPPVFVGDEDKTRVSNLVNLILLMLLVWVVIAGASIAISLGQIPILMPFIVLILFGVRVALFRGYVRLVSILIVAGAWLLSTAMGVVFVGATGFLYVALIFTIVLAVSFLGVKWGGFVAAVSVVTAGVIFYLDMQDLVMMREAISVHANVIGGISILILITALLSVQSLGLREVLARARRYSDELETQQSRLEGLVESRTRDLERRARYLEATAVVARDSASELGNLPRLLLHVVNLISERFGFYHVGLFLIDPTGEWAELRSASSSEGARMLARKHRLRVGAQGIVGYVTSRGLPRIARDVDIDALHYKNPDLPETRSEMALPLRVGGEIIGALDVQTREAGTFSEEDISALQSLADQVSVAITNARLLERIEESVEAERRAFGQISAATWRRLLRSRTGLAFINEGRDTAPAGEIWRPEMDVALQTGAAALDGENRASLAIPIMIRGQVIGVVDGRKSDDSGAWSPEEQALLEALTRELEVALESARLFESTQLRAAREQLVSEVTAQMRQSLDVDAVLRTAVRQMGEALGLARLDVKLDLESAKLESQPGNGTEVRRAT